MHLQRLAHYSEEISDSMPVLYGNRTLRYYIDLDENGQYLGITDTANPTSRREKRGIQRALPQIQRTSSIRPVLLADVCDYTFGYTGLDEGLSPDEIAKSKEKHLAYVSLLKRCYMDTQEQDVNTVIQFLTGTPLEDIDMDASFDIGGVTTFRVNDRVVVDNPKVQSFWAEYNSADSDNPVMQCFACLREKPVLERMQTKVKGLPGGQMSGTAIISANNDAFHSYGLHSSLVAPTCYSCGEKFTAGLNALLSGDNVEIRTNNVVVVGFGQTKEELNFLECLTHPKHDIVSDLIRERDLTNKWNGYADAPFYLQFWSGSGGRSVLRQWLDSNVPKAKMRLCDWLERQYICTTSDETEERYYGVWALAATTERETKEIMPDTLQWLVQCALTGEVLPDIVLYKVLQNCRIKQGVNRLQASLIKLCLMTSYPAISSQFLVNLETEENHPAYLSGRLLALIEQIQRQGQPGIKNSIVSYSYATISVSSKRMFEEVLRKNRVDFLPKLRSNSAVLHNAMHSRCEKLIADIKGYGGFIETLSPREQGYFALGYYHQRVYEVVMSRKSYERYQERHIAKEIEE